MREHKYQTLYGAKKPGNGCRVFFVLCSLFFVLSFSSCATTHNNENIKMAEAHNRMGYSHFNEGRLNEAYAEFQKAVQLDPANKNALNQLGYISVLFKKHNEAIAYYKRAIEADPNYSEALNNLGVIYLELENWDEAIKCFQAALKNALYRSPEKAYSSMGYAYYRKGDYAAAETFLKEALLRNPVFTIADYTLGLVYIKQGDDNAAIEEFQKVIGIMPDDMDTHWELANAYLRTGERASALKHFRIVAAKDKDIKRSRSALEYLELLQ